jgi:hypothetical protein
MLHLTEYTSCSFVLIFACLQYQALWNVVKLNIPAVCNLYKQYTNLIFWLLVAGYVSFK